MGAQPPRLDGDQIAAALKAGSREPFRELLEIFLKAAPTSEEVAEVARRAPDRYVQGVTMLAKLSGFHEKMQVDHNHSHKVMALMQLSDSELMGRLQDGLEQLGIDPQTFRLLLAEKRGIPELSEKGNGAKS